MSQGNDKFSSSINKEKYNYIWSERALLSKISDIYIFFNFWGSNSVKSICKNICVVF